MAFTGTDGQAERFDVPLAGGAVLFEAGRDLSNLDVHAVLALPDRRYTGREESDDAKSAVELGEKTADVEVPPGHAGRRLVAFGVHFLC